VLGLDGEGELGRGDNGSSRTARGSVPLQRKSFRGSELKGDDMVAGEAGRLALGCVENGILRKSLCGRRAGAEPDGGTGILVVWEEVGCVGRNCCNVMIRVLGVHGSSEGCGGLEARSHHCCLREFTQGFKAGLKKRGWLSRESRI
jgi:hypothetical protein